MQLDPSKRGQEFEEFRRTAEEYIRAAREYLGEPPESEMTTFCRNDGELMPIISQILPYHVRSLRHYRMHMAKVLSSSGKAVGATA